MEVIVKLINGFDNYALTDNQDVVNIKSGRTLRVTDTGRGYKTVVLYKNGERISKPLHRLVCETYKPVDGMEKLTVDHIDGNKLNNHPDNLEFVTATENIKRYWRNKTNKKIEYSKVDVYFCKDGCEITYPDYLTVSRVLRISRYETLRRLSLKSPRIFKDLTMMKYHDGKPFDKTLIGDFLTETKTNKEIQLYNHLTGEELEVPNLTSASAIVKKSQSAISFKLNYKQLPIFNNGWEVKYKSDNREWSKPTKLEFKKILNGGIFIRPIKLIEASTGKIYEFKNCKEASSFLNIKPNLFNYRITRNQTKPQKDGFIYQYDE